MRLVLLLALLVSCKVGSIDRKYKDIREVESIDVSIWKGWVVVSYPDNMHAIIRNNNRAIKIECPKWTQDLWQEGDTIQ